MAGIYFMPFLIDRTVEGFTGKSPFDAAFAEERRLAVRRQIRNLALISSNDRTR